MVRKAKSDSLSKKAYKFRIYPSEEQKIFFAKTFGCTRFIYNQMLADKISYYEKTKGMLHNTPAHELYVDSEGIYANYPKYYRQEQLKLAREQRKFSKMEKGSKNREKQRIKLAIVHEKVANQRKDFLHKLSKKLIEKFDCVCIEDLNMKALSQVLNFGKSVMDNGWGMFVNFLDYKSKEVGKKLVKVGKYFASSQICSNCGYKNKEVKDLSIRQWKCPNCKVVHDRDINAAINIRNEGMRIVLG